MDLQYMWKEIEVEGVVCLRGQRRYIELKQLLGMGKELSFQLIVEGRPWGPFFKGQNGWISQDDLSEDELQSLINLVEEALKYDRLNLTLAVPVGDETRTMNIYEVRTGVYVLHIHKWGYDYYRGRIWKRDGYWTGDISHGAWNDITGEDLPVLGDIIEENKKVR